MRFRKLKGSVVAAFLASSSPALAQYGAPFGSPGMLTTPEMANGVIGAGAAGSTAPTYCGKSGIGRDGPHGCSEDPPPPRENPHR